MLPDIYNQLEINKNDRHTAITRAEGEAIFQFITDKRIKKTLEVGFGYGVSAAYILAATGSLHYVIDPHQNNGKYQGLGIKNIKKLKLKHNLKFFEDYSHSVLPKLNEKGLKFNFVFIDGGHNFDTVFVDFYFADLMLNDGGYVLLHDTWLLSIQTVAEWIRRNKKNYKVVKFSAKNCILFQKKGEDKRKWYHFNSFAVKKRQVVKKLVDYVLN